MEDCEGPSFVGLFDPSASAPRDNSLAGPVLGAPPRGCRKGPCAGSCRHVVLLLEDAAASPVLCGKGGGAASAVLCDSCASVYENRIAVVGCASCAGRLAVGLCSDLADITMLCARCALVAERAAAVEHATAPLLLELDDLRVAPPKPPQHMAEVGPDGLAPRFDRCGELLGRAAAPYQCRGQGGVSHHAPGPAGRRAPDAARAALRQPPSYCSLPAGGSLWPLTDYCFFKATVRGMVRPFHHGLRRLRAC